jgi:hypothetical protein
MNYNAGAVAVNSEPNPTTSIYNATGSLAHSENKIFKFYFEKRSSLLQRWRWSCRFQKS